jgi:hypothetical protein
MQRRGRGRGQGRARPRGQVRARLFKGHCCRQPASAERVRIAGRRGRSLRRSGGGGCWALRIRLPCGGSCTATASSTAPVQAPQPAGAAGGGREARTTLRHHMLRHCPCPGPPQSAGPAGGCVGGLRSNGSAPAPARPRLRGGLGADVAAAAAVPSLPIPLPRRVPRRPLPRRWRRKRGHVTILHHYQLSRSPATEATLAVDSWRATHGFLCS